MVEDPEHITYSMWPSHTLACVFASLSLLASVVSSHSRLALILLGRVLTLVLPSVGGGRLAEVDAELPSVDGLVLQYLPGLLSARDVDEVGVGEASRLAGASVNGNADIHHVANVAEEIVEVLVRHLKRHVSDEERLAGRVLLEASSRGAGLGAGFGEVELDDEVAALEYLHVEVVDGRLGVAEALELDVAEPFIW
jgi:hypothetical protein